MRRPKKEELPCHERLAYEIMNRAQKDYRHALKMHSKYPTKGKWISAVAEVESFLLSDWAQELKPDFNAKSYIADMRSEYYDE